MLGSSKSFQVMRSGLDALAEQQKVILHNLANYETPNYKTKRVEFQEIMKTATEDGKYKYSVRTKTVEDNDLTIRVDGNNVDADLENLNLYENYMQQLYLQNKISGQITNYRNVLKNGPR